MDIFTILIMWLIILVIISHIKLLMKLKGMPRGPMPLPLIGNLPAMIKDFHLKVCAWRSYGDLSTVSVFQTPIVILNSYNVIHEAFITRSDIFSGRVKKGFNYHSVRGSGIAFQDGYIWQEHRRFVLRALREFGFGKRKSEESSEMEVASLLEYMRNHLNEPISTPYIYTPFICNVVARIVFGEHVERDDPVFQKFLESVHKSNGQNPVFFLPVLDWAAKRDSHISGIVNKLVEFHAVFDDLHNYFRVKIDKREKELRSLDDPPTDVSQANDLCDYVLIEKLRQEKEDPELNTFSEWQVIRDLGDIYIAGTDTTVSTLVWATLLMATHPEVDAKVYEEITRVVGLDRPPKMTDRHKLHYVCAVIDEVLRFSTLLPLNVLHRVTEDTTLQGFSIPKDTPIISNLYGVHRNPEYWKHPDKFYPEHFLDENGEYRTSKYLIPFSVGKRACLGESLARMEIYLTFSSIFQSFCVRVYGYDKSMEELLTGSLGLLLAPNPHKIIFSKR